MGKAARKRREARAAAVVVTKTPAAPPSEAVPVERLQRLDFILSFAVAVMSFLVYLRTLTPSIYTSGAGENVTAVATLGVPHPPGFPLFCLLGKLFTILVPVGEIAYRVNLFSAVCGSAAVAMMFVVITNILGRGARMAAACASLLFGVSRTFWSQAVIAEVYTLNALLLLLIIFFLLRWERGGSLLPAGFAAGLALTVHPLQALSFPGWLLFITKSPARGRIKMREVQNALLLMATGFSLHLYAPIRSAANPVLDWGNPENFTNFVAYLSASQYRGRMFSMPFSEVSQNFLDAAKLLIHQFSPWLFVLTLAGAWLCFRANRRFFYATAISAAIVIFYAINYDIPWEIDVYYIPVVLVLAMWSAFALDWLGSRMKNLAYALPVVALLPLFHNFYANDRSQHTIARALGEDILNACPPNATLIVPNRDATFAVLYLTAVEHKRPDVSIWVDSGRLRRLADALNPGVFQWNEIDVLRKQKIAFQYERILPDIIPGFQQIPYGVLYQLVPKSSKITTPQMDFASYRLDHFVNPQARFYLDEDSKIILANYYFSRGDAANAMKKEADAQQEYKLAAETGGGISEVENQLAARSSDAQDVNTAIEHLRQSLTAHDDALTENRLGRLLIQTHQYEDAMNAFDRAIKLDPNLAMAHSNLGALLGMQRKITEALAELQLAVKLDPNNTLAHNNLARAYIMTRNLPAAVSELQKSLALDANQPEIQNQLTTLQKKMEGK